MQNLREKLLKAGLITESDKQKAEAEKSKERARPQEGRPHSHEGRPARGGRPDHREAPPRSRGRPAGREAPIPKLPPLALPNNKEYQRLEAKKQLELDRKIREIVLAAQVAVEPGEHTFYFVTRKNRLRRIEMTPAQAQLLESGQLAVVERPDPGQIEHALVPVATAEELMKLHPKTVRFLNKPGAPVGFLSDEEISRRQKIEADRAAREAQASTLPSVTLPEDAEDSSAAAAETPAPSEELAAQAERTSTLVPGANHEVES